MAKVKVLKESELIGGTDNSSVYPITHTKAIFNSDNKELDQILNDIKKKIDTAETNITSNENLIDTLEVSLEATNEVADTALRILTFASTVENVKVEEQFVANKFNILYDIGKNYFVALKDGKYYISFIGHENYNTTSYGVIKARKDRLFWSLDDDFIYRFDGIKLRYFAITDDERAKLLAYPAKPLDIPLATESSQGLMSAEDKRKINKETQPWTNIVWSGHNMNEFTEFGEYYIHGERTNSSDNLPILNAASGHTIEGTLKVYDSSIAGTGKDTDKVVTQILSMSNRTGADGHIWIRTGQGSSKLNLTWSTWEKLQGIFEKNNVTTLEDLDGYTTNGMYSGIYAGTEPKNFYTVRFLPLDTFLMITVNGYAVSKLAVPQITQLLYKLPAKTSTSAQNAEMYIRTGSWNADEKKWVWGTFSKMATNADLSAKVAALTSEIDEKVAHVQELANQSKTDAARAQGTANSAQTAAQEAKTAAETAQANATGVNTKITELSLVLVKTGVISQVQTWTQAADNGYDYVMSGLVRGVIPQANIDLFTSAGAIFNKESGYFELNGLTDISYEEMLNIYNAYNPNPWNGQQGMLVVKNTRTFLPANNDIVLAISFSGERLCYTLSDIEAINIISTPEKIKFNNLRLAWFFNFKLKNIQNLIDCSKALDYVQAFEKCYSLVDVRLWRIIASVSFKDCARLSNSSILYMINNEAATSPITITLHADVYNRCMANEDILAALEAHTNISLASA